MPCTVWCKSQLEYFSQLALVVVFVCLLIGLNADTGMLGLNAIGY